jgi:hypothetical protein
MKISTMNVSDIDRRNLQRTRYWQGQTLRSGDFRSQLQTEAQLRWWHNRALHHAYGVAVGLETSKSPQKGNITAIHVDPGVAYDCFGRALILQSEREIPLPDASLPAASFTLVARYRETAEFPDPRQASGVCFSCCEGSTDWETPDFIWKATSSLRVEDGVPLGRLLRGPGALEDTLRLDTSFVPVTPRPLARPYLADGSTIPGSTAWGLWRDQSGLTLGFETVVDTSAAGFTRVPCYFAALDGLNPTAAGVGEFIPLILTHVQDVTPNSFRFRMLALLSAQIARRFRLPQLPFYVRWSGCQSPVDADRCLATAVEKPCCG